MLWVVNKPWDCWNSKVKKLSANDNISLSLSGICMFFFVIAIMSNKLIFHCISLQSQVNCLKQFWVTKLILLLVKSRCLNCIKDLFPIFSSTIYHLNFFNTICQAFSVLTTKWCQVWEDHCQCKRFPEFLVQRPELWHQAR